MLLMGACLESMQQSQQCSTHRKAAAVGYRFKILEKDRPAGPAAAAQTIQPRQRAAAMAPDELKILTYNVWIAPLVRWAPAENLDKICDFVRAQGADVVCMQEVFDWHLGPLGKLCDLIFWGSGTDAGPLSWIFYFEGLLLPFFNTQHQARIAASLKGEYPHALFSKPRLFGHNQGLLLLSKYPLGDTVSSYQPGLVVHHMGTQACTLLGEAGLPWPMMRIVNLHLVPDFRRHAWKGRLLAALGERDAPKIQQAQLVEVGKQIEAFERAGEEGAGALGRWCVVGDFNHNGPTVLGKGSRVVEVTCPQESHILDHFVTPVPYEYRVFSDNRLSDHFPVLATLRLR